MMYAIFWAQLGPTISCRDTVAEAGTPTWSELPPRCNNQNASK